jgi:hypothetical protein
MKRRNQVDLKTLQGKNLILLSLMLTVALVIGACGGDPTVTDPGVVDPDTGVVVEDPLAVGTDVVGEEPVAVGTDVAGEEPVAVGTDVADEEATPEDEMTEEGDAEVVATAVITDTGLITQTAVTTETEVLEVITQTTVITDTTVVGQGSETETEVITDTTDIEETATVEASEEITGTDEMTDTTGMSGTGTSVGIITDETGGEFLGDATSQQIYLASDQDEAIDDERFEPVMASDELDLDTSLDEALFGEADVNGENILTINGRPVYRYIGDVAEDWREAAAEVGLFPLTVDGELGE